METKTITLRNGRKIGDGQPAFIVAEIGQNHQGNVGTAMNLGRVAYEAGCDAVKMTKRDVDSELTAKAAAEPYNGPQSFGATYGEHRRALELDEEDYGKLETGARFAPMLLFATACDIASVDFLERVLDPPLYKVASRDLDNMPLIEHIAKTGKPVVLSTGFAGVYYPNDLEEACDAIRLHHDDIVVLYCVSKYPTPDADISLRNIDRLRGRLGCLVGFSDHTIGIHLGPASVQAGACIVEKHITLSRANKGTDHAASLEPEALRKYVRNIRGIEAAMSKEPEQVQPDPETVAKLGRSWTTTRAIEAGEYIKGDMACLKSPGDGLKAWEWQQVVGLKAKRAIPADTTISIKDIVKR